MEGPAEQGKLKNAAPKKTLNGVLRGSFSAAITSENKGKEGIVEFLCAEIEPKLKKLIEKNKLTEEAVTKILRSNDHMINTENTDRIPKLTTDILAKIEELKNIQAAEEAPAEDATATTETAIPKAETEEPKKQHNHGKIQKVETLSPEAKLIKQMGISEGKLVFTQYAAPLLIKSVDLKNAKVVVENETGATLELFVKAIASNKDSRFISYLVLRKGKQMIAVSPEIPQLKTAKDGVQLALEDGNEIDLENGDTFTDTEGKEWTIQEIADQDGSVVLVVTDSQNKQDQIIALTNWYRKDKNEILKTLGNKLSLTRPEKQVSPDAFKQANTKELKTRFLDELQFSYKGTVEFTLKKGEAYWDDDKTAWTVTALRETGNKKLVTIKNEAGEEKTLEAHSFDSEPGWMQLYSSEADTGHAFNLIPEEPAQATTPKIKPESFFEQDTQLALPPHEESIVEAAVEQEKEVPVHVEPTVEEVKEEGAVEPELVEDSTEPKEEEELSEEAKRNKEADDLEAFLKRMQEADDLENFLNSMLD